MSTISVRVTLLILATVMFATIWSNDHKPRPVKRHTVVAYEFPTVCPVNVNDPANQAAMESAPVKKLVSKADFLINLVVSENVADEPVPLSAEKPQSIRVSELSFPLPRDLTAGEYRIIDRFGSVESLSITQSDLLSWGIGSRHLARNSYEVCEGDRRWHFIRIEQPVKPAPTQAEIADAWKSVFRFAGRKANPAIKQASTPITRWLSGEWDLSGEPRELR